MTKFESIFKTFDKEKQNLIVDAIAEADKLNDYPSSGDRHSNHKSQDGSSIMNILELAESMNPEQKAKFLNDLVAAGIMKPAKPKEDPKKQKQKPPKK